MNLANKIIECPVCNYKASFYKKLKEVTLYFCDNCKHRFTDIESIQNKETYTLEYFKKKHPNWFKNQNFELFNYIFNIIKSTKIDSPSVLDACCGQGDLLKYLKQKSNKLKLTGIDFHKNETEEEINFLCGDIFKTEFKEKFDVIVNLASVEHVWNVQDYMNILSKNCKNGGIIITMTINDSSLVYSVARTIYNFGMKLPMERLYDKHHLNHFSKNSLEYLHTKNSLDIIGKPYTKWPMKSVDIPKSNFLIESINKLALFALFISEKLLGKSILQTIAARKKIN
tara:strand:+ start:64 stop:915 length:852 start_codon:yes stop_codon:yes gene_type:complete